MRERVYKGDSAIIEANLFDEDGVNFLPASTVSWKIRKPNAEIAQGGPDPVSESTAVIAFSETNLPGSYHAQVTFDLSDTTKRSTVLSFEVIDPLETTTHDPAQSGTDVDDIEVTVDRAWMKLEDLFDSDLGGPHLRDRTLAIFDREKMKRLLPDAFYNINNYYQPATGYDETTFPYTGHGPLLSQALLVESIMHLMRSYVEQPAPVGAGTPTYFDRRDYLNRWGLILQGETRKLEMWLDLFKRGEMGFGQSSLLVGGYASYTNRVPRYMRGRYPYIYRW